MNILLLVVCQTFLTLVTSQSYKGVLALSWLSGFCHNQQQTHQENCEPSLVALWDSQSHTIHGMWPDQESSTSYGAFNINLFQSHPKLLDDMHNYWPPKVKHSSDATFLWRHQWEKHGKDYAKIVLQLRSKDFPGNETVRNAALQIAFFQDTINFYQRLHAKKIPGKTFTGSKYAATLGVAEKQIVFSCFSGNKVREVQVCFQIVKEGFQLINCSKSSTTCVGGGSSIELSDWAFKGQARVFNYPRIEQEDGTYLTSQ